MHIADYIVYVLLIDQDLGKARIDKCFSKIGRSGADIYRFHFRTRNHDLSRFYFRKIQGILKYLYLGVYVVIFVSDLHLLRDIISQLGLRKTQLNGIALCPKDVF